MQTKRIVRTSHSGEELARGALEGLERNPNRLGPGEKNPEVEFLPEFDARFPWAITVEMSEA